MNRKELESKIMWNGGGTGFGICRVGNMMAWELQPPAKPDLLSIVAVGLPKGKYTKEELTKICIFSERATKDYNTRNRYRRGANLICLDKREDGKWLRKRMSWTMGGFFSDTLDEAIAVMER
jgi:hypothetical protein